MTQEPLDLLALRSLKVDAESARVALTAASIIVQAHGIARRSPDLEQDATRIIGLTRQLYAVLPSRAALREIVDDFVGEVAGASRVPAAARDRLVERLWQYFHHGTPPARP